MTHRTTAQPRGLPDRESSPIQLCPQRLLRPFSHSLFSCWVLYALGGPSQGPLAVLSLLEGALASHQSLSQPREPQSRPSLSLLGPPHSEAGSLGLLCTASWPTPASRCPLAQCTQGLHFPFLSEAPMALGMQGLRNGQDR